MGLTLGVLPPAPSRSFTSMTDWDPEPVPLSCASDEPCSPDHALFLEDAHRILPQGPWAGDTCQPRQGAVGGEPVPGVSIADGVSGPSCPV